MDGSYSQPFGRSQSPQTPSTPSGSYQVNVSRQKTRKWVEAKVQNYDGDDWGADEYDDESEPEPTPAEPPQPAARPSRPSATPRLPSESRRPAEIQVPPVPVASVAATTPRSADLPPLQTENQDAPVAPAVNQPQSASYNSPALPESTTLGMGSGKGSFVTPQSSIARRQNPLVGASQTQPSAPMAGVDEALAEDGAAETQQAQLDTIKEGGNENNLASAQDIDRKGTSASPQLPNVSRLSSFGMDFTIASDDPVQSTDSLTKPSDGDAVNQSKSSTPPTQSGDTTPDATEQPPSGPEGAKKDPEDQALRPSLPGGWVTETPSVAESSTPGPRPLDLSKSRETSSSRLSTLEARDPKSLPPLRTPSPHGDGNFPPEVTHAQPAAQSSAREQEQPSATPRTAHSDIPATQPLRPQRHGETPTEYDLPHIQRQITHSTTTSSPQKESDILRDEIIKSLSPSHETSPSVPPVPQANRPGTMASSNYSVSGYETSPSVAPAHQAKRTATGASSKYSLSGYDAYWAEQGSDDTTEPAQPLATQEPQGSTTAASVRPDKELTEAQARPSDDRRRFSWEMESADVAKPPRESTISDDAQSIALSQEPTVVGLVEDEPAHQRDPNADKTMRPPSLMSPGLAGISHQVSKASTLPPAASAGLAPIPPSPVSVLSEKRNADAPDGHQAPAPENAPTESAPTPPAPSAVSAASGSDITQAPAPSANAAKHANLPAFKEIMARPTSAERAAKFDETRDTFATLDSGLDNWITTVKSQNPEHANVTASFSDASSSSQGIAPSSSSGQPAAPQPYYQQYINASSQAVNAPAAGRARQPAGSPLAMTSSFGTSGNQIGAKGKEFMQSAGKMGKGLLSKGRNRLRGDKDKDKDKDKDARPPPVQVQTKPKNTRRTSWGLTMGSKGRNGADPQSSQQEMTRAMATPTPPPQFSRPSLSDLPDRAATPASQGRPSRDVSIRPQPDDSGSSRHADPYRGTPWQASSTVRAHAGQHQPTDWGRPSEDASINHQQSQTTLPPPPPIPEDSGIGFDLPKRAPSFVGLPPIKRNSGLDLTFSGDSPGFSFLSDPDESDEHSDHEKLTDDAINYTNKPLPREPPQSPGVDRAIQTESNPPRVAKPIGEPVAKTPPQPAPEQLTPSHTEPVHPPTTQPIAQPVTQHVPEPIQPAQPLNEPVTQQAIQPVAQPVRESIHDPVNPVTQPLDDSRREHVHEPVHEPTNLPVQEPVAPVQHIHEPVHEPVDAPVQQQIHEPVDEPRPEPVGAPVQQMHERAQAKQHYAPPSQEAGPSSAPPAQRFPPVQTQMMPNQFPMGFPAGQWKLEESHLTEPLAPMSRNRSGTGSSMQPVVYGYDKETGLPLTGSPETNHSPSQTSPTRTKGYYPPSSAQRHPDLLGQSNQPPQSDSRSFVSDIRGDAISETSVAMEDPGRKKKRSSFLPSLRSRDQTDLPSRPSQESFHGRKGSFAGSIESTERKRGLLGGAFSAMSATSRQKLKAANQPRAGTPSSLNEVYRPGENPSEASLDLRPPNAPATQKNRHSRSGSASEIVSNIMSHIPGPKTRDSTQPAFARTAAGGIEPQQPTITVSDSTAPNYRRSQQISPGFKEGSNPNSEGAAIASRTVRSPAPSGPAPPVPPPPPPEQRLLPEGAQMAPIHTQLYGPPKTSIQPPQPNVAAERGLKAQRSPESSFDQVRNSTPEPGQSAQAVPSGRGGTAMLKELRNRVQEQVSQVTQRGDEKGPASRIRNAFKRGSRQVERPPGGQPGQWRPSPPGSQPPQNRQGQPQPSPQGPGMRGAWQQQQQQGRAPPGAPQNNQMGTPHRSQYDDVPAPPGFIHPGESAASSPAVAGRGFPQGQQQTPAPLQSPPADRRRSGGAAHMLNQAGRAGASSAQDVHSPSVTPPIMPPRPDNSSPSHNGEASVTSPPLPQRPDTLREGSSYNSGASRSSPNSNLTNGKANTANTPRLVASPSPDVRSESRIGASPALHPSTTQGSNPGSDVSRTTVGDNGGRAAEPEDDVPMVELEDTEEARKRALRLESQEEKILYDPEDDPNAMPVMSATSYPGQEWNPYGMEYGDWRDD